MMTTLTFTRSGDWAQKLDIIKRLADQKGVTFRENLESGSFSGEFSFLGMGIRGSYAMSGDRITVDVIEKPTSYF